MKQNGGGVTGFGSLRGNDNIGRLGKPSGASNQDMTTDVQTMVTAQKKRRRRLLEEPSAMSMPAMTVGSTVYAPKSSTSKIELPPPLSQKSPLDAVKVVQNPNIPEVTQEDASGKYGVGGTPMVGLLKSLLETSNKNTRIANDVSNDDGGYITTGIPGGVPTQPSPIDLPKNKLSLLEEKGFTTPMYETQSPVSTAMTPNAQFDHLNQIARAYGIQGTLRTDQLPATLSVFGGKEFKDGAPIIPRK
jgi:hypothetical protein